MASSLVNAQGEDVVAGIRTPQHLTEAAREAAGAVRRWKSVMPEAFPAADRADQTRSPLPDMQDIEFTIAGGKLWMLQTRSGKRTRQAALKIAVDMARTGLITSAEAVARDRAGSLDQLLHPSARSRARARGLTRGLPASPGAHREWCSTAPTAPKTGEAKAARRHPGARSRPARKTFTACMRPGHSDHAAAA